ncbi:MAG: hypothetical protein KKH61_21315 [Gammaproteobacteria bacterium]|uniref:Uncharacterized protein n=1 Tax=viral metagenome TaxID=1070528 RepID=A0A6H1Z9R2_9ZZZZ|nr:hypothetical protein [Gammaproteobacteria bacterium]
MGKPLGNPKIYGRKDPTLVAKSLERKKLVFKHNSFLGHAAMTRRQMYGIMDSVTVTPEAKSTADEIAKLSIKLAEQLKTRVPWEEAAPDLL